MPEQPPRVELGNIMESDKRTEKQRAWEQKLKELDHITDGLGEDIDKQIKEVVGALNVNGFNTYQSCEGHAEKGRGAPWVWIEAPDEPEGKYIGEKEAFQKIADRYGISYEDAKEGKNEAAWIEVNDIRLQNGETPEFVAWREENARLKKTVEGFLEDFYKNRSTNEAIRIVAEDVGGVGAFRVHNGGEDFARINEFAEEQKAGFDERLLKYRQEMEAFGKFLKERFLTGNKADE